MYKEKKNRIYKIKKSIKKIGTKKKDMISLKDNKSNILVILIKINYANVIYLVGYINNQVIWKLLFIWSITLTITLNYLKISHFKLLI